MIATIDSAHHTDLKRHGPSTLLRITAWYFKLGGIVFAFITVSGLISGVALQRPSSTNGLPYPLALVILSATSVVLFITGILLARRSRIGAVLGLGLTLSPIAFAIADRRNLTLLELGMAGVTVLALLLIWRELEWPRSSSAA